MLRDSEALNSLSLDRYDEMRTKQREIPEDAREVPPAYVPPTLPPGPQSATPGNGIPESKATETAPDDKP